MRISHCLCFALLLIAPRLPAHETSGMHEVEELASAWLTGLLNGNGKALAALLTDDATADVELANQAHFDDGAAFVAYLQPILREFSVHDIRRDVAFFTPQHGVVRVGPLVTSQGAGANVLFAWFLDARETPAGWRISHVTVNLEGVPKELVQIPRPEQHAGKAMRIRILDSVTNQPLAARVSILDSQKRYWPPQGHQYEIPTGWREDVGGDMKVGERVFAYVDSPFIAELPAGRYEIEVNHGLAVFRYVWYVPSHHSVRQCECGNF